jgi:hypothetical protein
MGLTQEALTNVEPKRAVRKGQEQFLTEAETCRNVLLSAFRAEFCGKLGGLPMVCNLPSISAEHALPG